MQEYVVKVLVEEKPDSDGHLRVQLPFTAEDLNVKPISLYIDPVEFKKYFKKVDKK